MIGHEAQGMNLPASFAADFGQGVQEKIAVLIVMKDGFAVVTAVHDVVNGAGIFQAKLSGHAGILRGGKMSIKQIYDHAGLTPFPPFPPLETGNYCCLFLGWRVKETCAPAFSERNVNFVSSTRMIL